MALPFIRHLDTTSAWQQRPDSSPELVAVQQAQLYTKTATTQQQQQ